MHIPSDDTVTTCWQAVIFPKKRCFPSILVNRFEYHADFLKRNSNFDRFHLLLSIEQALFLC